MALRNALAIVPLAVPHQAVSVAAARIIRYAEKVRLRCFR
jgi:hypothetical protein